METLMRDRFVYPEIEMVLVAEKLIERAGNKTIARHYNRKKIIENMKYADGIRTWYNEHGKLLGVLVFSYMQPWFSDGLWVVEDFIVKLDDNFKGLHALAMEELEKAGHRVMACAIQAGDMLADSKVVENGYMKRGKYNEKYSIFVKELTYD